MKVRTDYIAEIREHQAELDVLGVKREPLEFRRMTDAELAETADSINEQLKTRKRFLERAGNGKTK